MPAVIEMVRRSPDVRFVLDHIGKPGIKAGLFEPWRQHMRELAGMENVFCKISGVVTEADHGAWTRDQIRPYIEHTLDCFGFERCMYGSDWHVLELASTYPQWVEIVDWIVADASAAERRRLFRETAVSFYRLDA
jgi:L-fuconolactonase